MTGQEYTIRIQREKLRYAIANKAHVAARSLLSTDKINYELASHMQPSDLDPDSFEVSRGIATAVSELRSSLSEYLTDAPMSDESGSADVAPGCQCDLTMHFILPCNYNREAFPSVRSGIHDYIVMRSLYAWYRESCPELAESCMSDAASALVRVKQGLFRRVRPKRGYEIKD